MSGFLDDAARRLAGAGVENARAEARLLLAHALGLSRDASLGVTSLMPEHQAAFDALVARRADREPFAYITGVREFWSLEFAVGPGVLVPRPDSETLIEQALAILPDSDTALRIGDLGTGTGALLIAALTEYPRATGLGIDASADALAYARRNVLAHNMTDRAALRLADWSGAPPDDFDLVFCNPPYIPSNDIATLAPEVCCHEPRAALDGGADGLEAYRGLADILPRLLRAGGWAILEIGAGQACDMDRLFAGSGLARRGLAADLGGVPRALVLQKA